MDKEGERGIERWRIKIREKLRERENWVDDIAG